ncbi:TetR/AcrR family transcriptional regulator [Nocardioides sp.]|uniref:TetR/AcrR family transcriptional regulator n=1 Tax=Nocardioides sp. TaxID=35761 RepID=UPI0039E2B51D
MSQQPPRMGRPPTLVAGQRIPERIMDVAERLFGKYGYEEVSIRRIVNEVGVTQGALYHHFDSKQDLFCRVGERVLRRQTERLEQILAEGGTAEEMLVKSCISATVATADELEAAWVYLRLAEVLEDAEQAEEMQRQRRRHYQLLRDLMREGQRTGVLRSDIPAHVLAFQMIGMIQHVPNWWRPDGERTARQLGEDFATLFLVGAKA